MKTITDHIALVRRHNSWRRGDETFDMVHPKELGEAIDAICDHAEGMELGWRNKWECAVEMAARAEVERDAALEKIKTLKSEWRALHGMWSSAERAIKDKIP